VADLIVTCARAGRPPRVDADALRGAAARLEPFGDEPPPPILVEHAGVLAAVAAPTACGTSTEQRAGDGWAGVCVGAFVGAHDGWSDPAAELPDGTYALARWDADVVELASDICGSRILWYVLTDDVFLASTSQRVLVMLLGDHQPEPAAVAWMLTSASLGAEVSWDARVRRVPPDARVTLDRGAWRLAVRQQPATFAPSGEGEAVQLQALRGALAEACAALDIDFERWVLPLSGGCDSRVLLANLVAAGRRPRCVTWTLRDSLRNPLSDVSIARLVARRFGVEHEVIVLDPLEADLDTAVDRFVSSSEGLTDEFPGYVDGLHAWRALRAADVDGIVRGDEGFGDRRAPEAEAVAIPSNAGPRAEDYPREHLVRRLGLASQTQPAAYSRLPGEDLRQYSVRLAQVAWVPTFQAVLHGPKTRFVEIANPLLSRRVVRAVRALTPRMLGRQRAYLALVAEVSRAIPTSRFSSTQSLDETLARPETVELLVRELAAPEMERVLPGDGARLVLTALAQEAAAGPGLRTRVRSTVVTVSEWLPIRLAAALRPSWDDVTLGASTLAFRAVVARRMLALLERDARALRRASRG